MTVKKLIQELQKCPEDLEVFTKKTEIMGTIGVSSNVYNDCANTAPPYNEGLRNILAMEGE